MIMKRNLLTQIKNEWRENVWFVIELMVVLLVIWATVTVLYSGTQGHRLPRGFDPENVYIASLNTVKKDSPHYVESENGGYVDDINAISKRISDNPNVESVSISTSYPYNYNYSGYGIRPLDTADSAIYYGNMRTADPGYVDVLKLKSLTGSTSAQLRAMLERGEILISDNREYDAQERNPKDLIGKRVIMEGDSTQVYRVGDVIEKIRRDDYEDSYAGCIVMPMARNETWGDLMVRVKPGCELKFVEDFNNKKELREQRNVYFTDLKSMTDLRDACQRRIVIYIRTCVIIMLFLLVTIFLGLLGSFWFRMQQRVSEIAIRMVCGARRRDIFVRVISEGMIILLIAAIPVTACVLPFVSDLANLLEVTPVVIIFTELISLLIVAVGVILSLWYPARRAMDIEPAEAIKSE